MAVSLLPKRKQRKGFSVNRHTFKENKSIIFGLAAILLAIVAYAGSYYYKERLLEDIEQVVALVEEVNAERNVPLEDDVLALDAKLSTIGLLLDNHVFTTKIFEFVESVTHPRVYFSNLSLETTKGEMTVSGVTDSYLTFGEQYVYLNNLEKVHDVQISGVQVTKDGQVQFDLSLSIDPEIYR